MMHQILTGAAVSLLAGVCFADPAFSVTFERTQDRSGVRVTAQFAGDADGTTTVSTVGDWGGVRADPSEFTDIGATAGGSSLAISHGEGCSWTISHAPGADVTLTYVLREPADRQSLGRGHNDYRTRVRPELFQMTGNHGLLYPEHFQDRSTREHRVEWVGFDAVGEHALSSFGPDRVETVEIDGDGFRQGLFIAGRLAYEETTIKGNRVGLVISGDEWGFTPAQFAELTFRIIKTERDFFGDHSDPWYLVSVTPEGRVENGSFSLGGTALTNCFALYCNAGISLDEKNGHVEQIRHVLAHEYFHTWNGVKFRVEGPEGSNYWFSEGFTEWFTRRMLRLAGLWDDGAVLRNLNESITGYDSNARKNAANDQVTSGFWKDPDLSQLPYRRGDLVALCLDEEIRRVSGGNRSLDDAFRDLVTRARGENRMPDRAALMRVFEKETSPEFVARLRACIDDGADPPLPQNLSEFGATLGTSAMQSFDPGFDVTASGEQKRIVGIKAGSGAERAGLRDGMPLRRANIGGGDPGTPPRGTVEVEIDGEWKTIEYEAVGARRDVRAYRR
ncbi:MAG: hypothetical protein L6Q35_06920 [Phycisphaerales bacterium]|nr:hypothetical protein [Phycisphaerales bacterium]